MALLPFRRQPAAPPLQQGYSLQIDHIPDGASINALLQACGDPIHPEERWSLALSRSLWVMTILDNNQALAGFVRATTDQALNANLWNLAARPGPDQVHLIDVLVHRSLAVLRRDLPGCSISISAPPQAFSALKTHGYILDPGGIRTMGLRLRTPVEPDQQRAWRDSNPRPSEPESDALSN